MDFFRTCLKKSGLVHFQRPQAQGLSMKSVFLEPCTQQVVLFSGEELFMICVNKPNKYCRYGY